MTDRQEKREIIIFKAFAKCCGLPIRIGSIKKMSPPKPDIQCEVEGTGFLSFELVEIIDQNFANMVGKQIDTKKQLNEFYGNFPEDQRERFANLYHNALIFPRFRNTCTLRQRKQLFPRIFDHLKSLDPNFQGDTLEYDTDLKDKLTGISISRGQLNGPIFDCVPGGWIGEPTKKIIKGKFGKTYQTDFPLHLLSYIDLNPMFPDETWLDDLKDFIQAFLKSSQFEKIWIFDVHKNNVKLQYP